MLTNCIKSDIIIYEIKCKLPKLKEIVMKLIEKVKSFFKDMSSAKKHEIWENVRMVLILLCFAAPFIFLIVMCLSYFV